MKKYVITENQFKSIIDNLMMEDEEQRKWNLVVQCFLNNKLKLNPPLVEDGFMGEKTKEAIYKYQMLINVDPKDGIWGEVTMSKMTPDDKKLYKNCVRKKLGRFYSFFQ